MWLLGKGYLYLYVALGCGALQGGVEVVIAVAIECSAGSDTLRCGTEEGVAIDAVEPEAVECALLVDVAQAIAVVQLGIAFVGKGEVVDDTLHGAHKFAHRLGRVGLDDGLSLTAIEEVVGEATVEALVRIGGEADGRYTIRRTIELIAAASYYLVELLAIVGSDVLDVRYILESAFDFE